MERVSDVLEKRCASILKIRQSKHYDIQEDLNSRQHFCKDLICHMVCSHSGFNGTHCLHVQLLDSPGGVLRKLVAEDFGNTLLQTLGTYFTI